MEQDRRKPTPGRGWRIARRTAALLLGLVTVLCLSGALWNLLAIRHYRAAFPPPGRLYAVHGKMMHLYCTGEGSPTVVLESGGGEEFLVWGKVQPVLARTARVCSYDRAGFGWSQPRPGPGDAAQVAEQLHALLQQAGIGAPLVLVGHSLGGIYIRVYAAHYPRDVAGLVFVDASSPDQERGVPHSVQALDHHGPLQAALLKSMMALGVARALGLCDHPPAGFERDAGWWRADACIPGQIDAYQHERASMSTSLAEAAHTGPFGDLPVLVLSRDPQQPRPRHLPSPVSEAEWRQWNAVHDEQQQALAGLSTRSRRVIARGSGHYIHFDRPDVVDRQVSAFVEDIREHRVPSSEASPRTE